MDRAEFRQWAMIYAMQGLLAGLGEASVRPKEVAESSVMLADTLLEANTIDEKPKQSDDSDLPRHIQDAVNSAIHSSPIDGQRQPISLCYVAVRAALKASRETK